MSDDDLKMLWERRRAKVAVFLGAAEHYKECEQCRSLALKSIAMCPYCGHYRFLESPERIRQTAREMGERPYPLSAGVVPRLFQVSSS